MSAFSSRREVGQSTPCFNEALNLYKCFRFLTVYCGVLSADQCKRLGQVSYTFAYITSICHQDEVFYHCIYTERLGASCFGSRLCPVGSD
jgi:hypothetical protein